ncbi:hypothetical protein H9P43_008416 [Blastocladiella emersonii ATCC 22665]|nr:hypothetical protein H9P43_008416 [Blastocladiella emersonii ATCC 22665]
MRSVLLAARLNVESGEPVINFFAERIPARFEDGGGSTRARAARTRPLVIPGTLVHETSGAAAGFSAAPPNLPSLEVDVERAGSPKQRVLTELNVDGGSGETQEDAGAQAGSLSALAAESALDAFLADDPTLDSDDPLRPPPAAQMAAGPGAATASAAGQFPHDRMHSAPARTPAAGTGTGGSAAGSVGDSTLGLGSTGSSGFGGSGGRFASPGRSNTSPLTTTTAFTHHPPPASLVSVATSPLKSPFDPLGSPRSTTGGASGVWPLQWSQAATAEHQVVMTELVRLIRFPLMRKEYLSGTVERTHQVMAWPAIKDLLLAAYKYPLFPPAGGAPGRVKQRGRLESPEFYI